MSSKKYVLDPSGKIKEIKADGDVKDVYAINVTDEYMQQQGDFFGDRGVIGGTVKIPATNFLPSGVKGLAAAAANTTANILPNGNLIGDLLSNNLKETGIIARETPVKTNSLFPDSNRDTLLVNPSFGADEDTKYYKNFNTAFSEFNANKNIFAEELEMVAGIEFNSLGFVSSKGLDITKLLFVFDYVIETTAYITAAVTLLNLNDKPEKLDQIITDINARLEKPISTTETYTAVEAGSSQPISSGLFTTIRLPETNLNFKKSPIVRYFHDILQFNYKNESKKDFNIKDINHLLSYFFIGLNEFLITDPKNIEIFELDKKFDETFAASQNLFAHPLDPEINLTKLIKNISLSFSKIGDNRLFLLIRKFQQESYWHSEILYKAKNDSTFGAGIGISAENLVDKFFAEFSQYYFKFIVERINVGQLTYKIDKSGKRIQSVKKGRISKYRFDKHTFGLKIDHEQPDSKNIYNWDINNAVTNTPSTAKSTTSILSLPQLLKINPVDKNLVGNNIIKQNFVATKEKRLPSELVKKIEDHLDGEYMPFYFHDLRTNEILAFHAFVDSISDSFSPNYNSTKGYGRIDDVRHYMDTTRSISTTFKIVSFNSDDHDMMWYQINKLVTMVYPQWSEGISSIRDSVYENFRFPFTQMPTASPLIRLRIGDVIKSNYSKKNLARLHGYKASNAKGRTTATKSANVQFLPSGKEYFLLKTDNIEGLSQLASNSTSFFEIEGAQESSSRERNFRDYGKKNTSTQKIYFYRQENDLIIHNDKGEFANDYLYFKSRNKGNMYYIVSKNDLVSEEISYSFNLLGVDVNEVINSTVDGKTNNPFTKAYETSRGKGLAGFITNLTVDYNEVRWETGNIGSKAPMMANITISFAPIHDIPPGLDHDGEMRAAVYNVGDVNKALFKDVYDDKV